MAINSEISWTDTTWNPLAGCTWASAGCDNCYAAIMARRLEFMAQADIKAGRDPGRKRKYIGITNKNSTGRIMFNGTVNLDEDALLEPFTWTKPRRVFVNSMSDLFHKDVPDGFIIDCFTVMREARQHTFQVLTKRPERMAQFFKGRPLLLAPNIWCGTSVENQAQADRRIPHLLNVPARIRFLSCEPLLGPIDLSHVANSGGEAYGLRDGLIHWLIAGGESGHGARPMHPDWARSLRDQCQAAGVAFHFKQWGAWKPISEMDDGEHDALYHPTREDRPMAHQRCKVTTRAIQFDGREGYQRIDGHCGYLTFNVGKHAAGRLLDGREWSEFPL